MKEITREKIIEEVNGLPYSKDMRLAFQTAKLTPYQFILHSANGASVHNELSQEQLISEIQRLGEKHYDKIVFPKYREFIQTSPIQWKDRPLSDAAKQLATNLLAQLKFHESENKEG